MHRRVRGVQFETNARPVEARHGRGASDSGRRARGRGRYSDDPFRSPELGARDDFGRPPWATPFMRMNRLARGLNSKECNRPARSQPLIRRAAVAALEELAQVRFRVLFEDGRGLRRVDEFKLPEVIPYERADAYRPVVERGRRELESPDRANRGLFHAESRPARYVYIAHFAVRPENRPRFDGPAHVGAVCLRGVFGLDAVRESGRSETRRLFIRDVLDRLELACRARLLLKPRPVLQQAIDVAARARGEGLLRLPGRRL